MQTVKLFADEKNQNDVDNAMDFNHLAHSRPLCWHSKRGPTRGNMCMCMSFIFHASTSNNQDNVVGKNGWFYLLLETAYKMRRRLTRNVIPSSRHLQINWIAKPGRRLGENGMSLDVNEDGIWRWWRRRWRWSPCQLHWASRDVYNYPFIAIKSTVLIEFCGLRASFTVQKQNR